jgi:metal-responsive CopG/Arc/MetJ family transcriptional regulator
MQTYFCKREYSLYMKIISLQLNEDLLERFEKVRINLGFNSKSEALRDAIIKFIETNENFEDLEGYKIMNISLVYPFKEVLADEVLEITTRYHSIIKSITDWRIAEKKIENLLVVGEFGMIKDLYKDLSTLKDLTCSIHEIVLD